MKLWVFLFSFFAFSWLLTIFSRWLLSRKLKKQLSLGEGYLFTPNRNTWDSYLAERDTPVFVLTVIGYTFLTAIFYFAEVDRFIWGINLVIGFFFLYRFATRNIPPTFGVTREGITILSWSPPFPIGSFGAASTYIPWHKVTLCEMQERGLAIFTEKGETWVVYTPEQEDEICAFVDLVLSSKGYHISTSRT